MRLLLAGQEVAGEVAGIERLDQHRDAGVRRLFGHGPQIVYKHRTALRRVGTISGITRQSMNARATDRLRIVERPSRVGGELGLAAGQCAQAGVATGGRTIGRVDLHAFEIVRRQARGNVVRRKFVRHQDLHAGEAMIGRRGEPIEEGMLGEQQREVGGKPGHRVNRR